MPGKQKAYVKHENYLEGYDKLSWERRDPFDLCITNGQTWTKSGNDRYPRGPVAPRLADLKGSCSVLKFQAVMILRYEF